MPAATTTTTTAQKQLWTLAAFNGLSSTCMLITPTALCSGPISQAIADATGLDKGAPSLGWQLPIALQMYGVALVYAYGARNNIKGIRDCATIGHAIFSVGTLMGVYLRPDINGGVPLILMGAFHGLAAAWMAADAGITELGRFVKSGMMSAPTVGGRKKAA